MQKFSTLFDHARGNVRKDKGLPPVPPLNAQPSPPAVARPETPPPPPRPPVTVDHGDWQKTMERLARLEPIIAWGEATRPGTWRLFSEVESQCLAAATDGHHPEYLSLKKSYLKHLGELCELYFAAHYLCPSIDILAFGLGMKEIRLHAHPAPPEIEGERIPFFIREIPLLCCATPDELLEITHWKEAIPGAIVI